MAVLSALLTSRNSSCCAACGRLETGSTAMMLDGERGEAWIGRSDYASCSATCLAGRCYWGLRSLGRTQLGPRLALAAQGRNMVPPPNQQQDAMAPLILQALHNMLRSSLEELPTERSRRNTYTGQLRIVTEKKTQ